MKLRTIILALAVFTVIAIAGRPAHANTPMNSCCNQPQGCCSPNICTCSVASPGAGPGCSVYPANNVLTFHEVVTPGENGGREDFDLYVPMSDGTSYHRMMDRDHQTNVCDGTWACLRLSEFGDTSNGANGAGWSEPTVNIGKSGEPDGSWSWSVGTEGPNPGSVTADIECFNLEPYPGMDFVITTASSAAGTGVPDKEPVLINGHQPQYVGASQVGNAFSVVLGTAGGAYNWPNAFSGWPTGGYWAGQYVDGNNYPYAYAYSPSTASYAAYVQLITFFVKDGFGNLVPLTASNYVYSSASTLVGTNLLDNDSPVACGFPVWATDGNDLFWRSGQTGCTQTGGCPYIDVQLGNNASIGQCLKLKNYLAH